MKDLSGKTALLTGASRGIGVYIARALADAGMNLALAARSEAGLESVRADVESRGVRTLVVPTDVGDPTALGALVQKTEAELGGVSVLVNNAGIEQGEAYAEVPQETIEKVIAVNLTGPMLLSRLVLPGMIERGEGHICNIASVAGLVGTPYNETYSATKHGLVGFSRGLRLTIKGEGYPVEVSVVCPGFIAGAGMYEDIKTATGIEAPGLVGTIPAERVAREVLRSIVENRSEVVLNSRPLKPLLVLSSIAPGVADWFASRAGIIDLFKKSSAGRKQNAQR